MGEKFVQPPSCLPIIENGKHVGTLTIGGPDLQIVANGKLVTFEMHWYCGPTPLRKDGEVSERIPGGFWDAYERWDLGGKLVDGNLCVVPKWCVACEGSGEIMSHIGGRHYESLGKCEQCQGRRIIQ